MNDNGNIYRVGYGRPPRHTRFQSGISGNPTGRPKGRRTLASDLWDELDQSVRVVEDGHEVTISKQRALVKALVAEGLKGDLRAIHALFHSLARQPERVTEVDDNSAPEDADIVASFAERQQTSDSAGAEHAE